MLNTLRPVFNTIFWMVAALFAGYAFADIFLSWFMPDALMAPSVLIAAGGFYFGLRWLSTDDVPQRPKTDFPLLQARVLAELNTQSQLRWAGLKGQTKRVVPRAATKLNRCGGHKGCRSPQQKPA